MWDTIYVMDGRFSPLSIKKKKEKEHTAHFPCGKLCGPLTTGYIHYLVDSVLVIIYIYCTPILSKDRVHQVVEHIWIT